jgi:hypothetical protein
MVLEVADSSNRLCVCGPKTRNGIRARGTSNSLYPASMWDSTGEFSQCQEIILSIEKTAAKMMLYGLESLLE